jgi:hypothetical protein
VHTVTVTDVNGCIATTSVSITEPTALIITESHIDVSAFGAADGSVDINVNGATAPYNYLWSDGSTTQDLNNLAAGTYTVTVTDANGCFDIRTIQILNPQCLLDATSSVTDASIHGASDGSISC